MIITVSNYKKVKDMSIGNRIADLRTNNHMSQFQLAKVLGIGTSTLGMYETNKRKPSPKVLNKIADYFDVSTDYLLGRKSKADQVHNATVDEALGTIMSFEGQPVTEHDKKVMKDLLESYLRNKE
ncbi:helix-turn-helix domain-containing protein [Limosilactobacillus reuteri]|nr:helix-turn-helix transcriptional regulator [Limosilactobacillus reuteri]EGC15216.1 DNA-binding helix-turn-helix protein [Limosilactobacillus reuteri MM4-1A]EEI08386.1 DNA-binding helix-turn-helix protein [Limosilactobacillus reuteri MM2-3]MCT3210432.1 XRE family transcriptional regulator [Limosilactobacillus reuteri]MQB78598.1 XRE family transcriptional regulator [Limosilactobacillus reuteri]OAV47543.1 transcriptional regulator [Limosilactobacillus reuteri]